MEKRRSLDEYISAKVVDKVSGVNTDMSNSVHWCFWESLLCFDICVQYFGGKLSPLENVLNHSWHVEDNLFNYPSLCFWAWSALSLLIPPHPKQPVWRCWQWEVNKRGGGGELTKSSRGLDATQPKLLSLLSCETAAAFKAVLRRDWQQLQLPLSFPLSLSARGESHLMGETTRKEWKPPLFYRALWERDIYIQLLARRWLFTLSDVLLWQFNKSMLHRFVANGGILEQSHVNY